MDKNVALSKNVTNLKSVKIFDKKGPLSNEEKSFHAYNETK